MLVVGAKGFAKEVLEILKQTSNLQDVVFYDDINDDTEDLLFGEFPILKSTEAVSHRFSANKNTFTIGVGKPLLRYKLYKKFTQLGGIYMSTISPTSQIGSYGVKIGSGCNILPNSILSNSVTIGVGCLIYYNVMVTHDCVVDDFVELSPNAILLGNVYIGSFTQIGANSTILPNVKIGRNVVIGAGSIVTKDIPDNWLAYGVPAKLIQERDALEY